MEYLKLKIELSINQDSNLTKLLNYDNNNSFLENNDMKLQSNQLKNNSNPVEIQFSTTNGIKCSCQECRLKRSRKNIELNSRLLSKQCIYVISTIFAFKNITDSIIGNIQAPKQILIAANEYKEEIFEKNDQFEVFFNKTIFSQTIIDKLLVYKVIRKTKTLINSYSCTRLGKLGLQSYLIPRIVHELDNSLRAIFQHQTEIRNEDLIPIFKKILVKQEKKVFENLASGIELWIQELPIEKIIKEMNMRSQPRIIYISDFYAIIESITRLYKFTREYLRTFYPEYDPLDIEKMHIQIRYGIKEDLIDWMKIFKDEDPKVFRKFIDNGVSTPTEFVKRTPDELEKLRIISYNTIRFLQNIATSTIGSNKKLYS